MLRNADDEPQIVLDQPLPRRKIAARHRSGERKLLRRGQQHMLADFIEVNFPACKGPERLSLNR